MLFQCSRNSALDSLLFFTVRRQGLIQSVQDLFQFRVPIGLVPQAIERVHVAGLNGFQILKSEQVEANLILAFAHGSASPLVLNLVKIRKSRTRAAPSEIPNFLPISAKLASSKKRCRTNSLSSGGRRSSI